MLAFGAKGQFNKDLPAENVDISFELDTLPELNSKYMEFSPTFYKNKLVFTSNRESDLLNYGMNMWGRNAYLSLFWVELGGMSDSADFKNVRKLSDKINIRDHTGPLTFTSNGEKAYFTRVSGKVSEDIGKVKKPSLFTATFREEKWEGVKELPFVQDEYAYAHPSVASKGNTLFFSSDREGSKGQKDIWVTQRSGEEWSSLKNLEVINSEAQEMFPYFKDSTLFFASDRSGGEGGLDLYASVLKADGSWTEPQNLGTSINSEEDDFGITLHRSSKWGFFSSNREGGKGEDDIYRFDVVTSVTVKKQEIAGKFEYRKLSSDKPGGMKVMLLNEDGEVVRSTVTDSLGAFSFEQLPGDKSYVVKLANEDEDMKLTLYGEDADHYMLSNKEGEFVYRKLSADKSGTMSLMDLDDAGMEGSEGKVSGQFVYEKLASDYPGGMKVMLVNEEGEVVRTTTTDEHGNFEFEKLSADKDYMIRLEEESDARISLLVYGKEDKVKAQLKPNEEGDFVYRKLVAQKGEQMALMNEDDPGSYSLKDTETLLALFEYDHLEGSPGGMTVVAETDDGEVVFTTKTDSSGYFRLVDLPVVKKLIIRPDSMPEDDMELTILNRNGEVVTVLKPDDKGRFVYNMLKGDVASMKEEKTEDVALSKAVEEEKEKVTQAESDATIVEEQGKVSQKEGKAVASNSSKIEKTSSSSVVFFAHNSSLLNSRAEKVLTEFLRALEGDPEARVKVDGYASAIGGEDYNEWLSRKRAKTVAAFLQEHGVDATRISKKAHGESSLVNDCKDKEACPDEEHAKNRRVKVSLIR